MENFNEIEQLMLTKSFEELSPKERSTVLASYSEKEYNTSRSLMLDTVLYKEHNSIDLSASHKEALMADFSRQFESNKVSFFQKVSLFLFPTDKQIFQKPGLQIAFASLLIVIGIWTVNNSNNFLGEQDVMAKLEEVKKPNSESKDVLVETESKELDKEVSEDEGLVEMKEKETEDLSDLKLKTKIATAHTGIVSKIDEEDGVLLEITKSELAKDKKVMRSNEVMDESVLDYEESGLSNTFLITEEPNLLDLLTATY